MEARPPTAAVPRANKALVVFLAVLQLILVVVYGIFVDPFNIDTLGIFEWLTLITIVGSIGTSVLTQVTSTSTTISGHSWPMLWVTGW